jgi:DNA-binding transcriptional regulator YiaG
MGTPEVVGGFEHPPLPNGAVELGAFLADFVVEPEIAKHVLAAKGALADNMRSSKGGDTLKSLRLSAGLSQTQFAEAIATSQSHVSRLEARIEKPNEDTMRRMAAVLKIDFNTLLNALARADR